MKEIKKHKMVGWYNPKQLITTAGKTIVSTIIGENADQRLTNASLTVQPIYDYSHELKVTDKDFVNADKLREDLWIDYVADVGDGWDSTALVAYHIARGTMPAGCEEKRRGEILIFGGDEVYPTSSQKEYRERLVAPYTYAADAAGIPGVVESINKITDLKEAPHVFAIPGNHDWYDSLYAFRYLFCARYFNRRIFAGGWRTRQRRSYFALKLPHDWWLFGIDLQLTHNIDWPQLEYFRCIINNTPTQDGQGKVVVGPDFVPGSKVIVCTPEPLWVEEEKYKGVRGSTAYDSEKLNLQFLEKMISDAKSKVRIYVAGDSHHYRRFASDDNRYQKITAGGGGAFLHPTHDIRFTSLPSEDGELGLRVSYPQVSKSKTLAYWNLAFLPLNLKFGSVTAALYAIIIWLFHSKLATPMTFSWESWKLAAVTTATDLIDKPWVVVITVILVAGLIFFTDTNSKWQKYLGGILHASVHLTAIFLIGWTGYFIYHRYFSLPLAIYGFNDPWGWAITVLPFSFLLGWLVGSIILGLYLLISLQLFGRHSNEAFSALKIKGFKNFLRLHINKDGLTIYPIKIDKVPSWKGSPLSKDGRSYKDGISSPKLIEDQPIFVPD